jgi:hypothetical protein
MRRWGMGCARCGGALRQFWRRCADGIEKVRWCERCDAARLGEAMHGLHSPAYRQILCRVSFEAGEFATHASAGEGGA